MRLPLLQTVSCARSGARACLEALLAHVERVRAQFGERAGRQAAQEALPAQLPGAGLGRAALRMCNVTLCPRHSSKLILGRLEGS